MPPVGLARDVDVAHDDDHPAARNEGVAAAAPHLVELVEEHVVVVDLAQLTLVVVVPLERPVRGGGHDEVDALRLQVDSTAVEVVEGVAGGEPADDLTEPGARIRVLGDRRKGPLRLGGGEIQQRSRHRGADHSGPEWHSEYDRLIGGCAVGLGVVLQEQRPLSEHTFGPYSRCTMPSRTGVTLTARGRAGCDGRDDGRLQRSFPRCATSPARAGQITAGGPNGGASPWTRPAERRNRHRTHRPRRRRACPP